MRSSAKEQQDMIDVVQKTLHAGLIAWAKVCVDAVIWCHPKTSGVCPMKWVNCVMCVGQSLAWHIKPCWSRYHYCHLGARAACSARDFRRELFCALPVRAVDGRHVLQCSWLPLKWDTTHTRTVKERDTGGGVATRLQRQSVIVECGWADRDQVLIEARRSVQCVVHFLENSAHKTHCYISRYPEIVEKKSRLIHTYILIYIAPKS